MQTTSTRNVKWRAEHGGGGPIVQKTKISWCDFSWNPTRGCSRISPGRKNCYAERIAARFPREFNGFAEFRIIGGHREPHWTGKVDLIESKLLEPLSWRKKALRFAKEHGRKPRAATPPSGRKICEYRRCRNVNEENNHYWRSSRHSLVIGRCGMGYRRQVEHPKHADGDLAICNRDSVGSCVRIPAFPRSRWELKTQSTGVENAIPRKERQLNEPLHSRRPS